MDVRPAARIMSPKRADLMLLSALARLTRSVRNEVTDLRSHWQAELPPLTLDQASYRLRLDGTLPPLRLQTKARSLS
jgi:hypothetical protein